MPRTGKCILDAWSPNVRDILHSSVPNTVDRCPTDTFALSFTEENFRSSATVRTVKWFQQFHRKK